MKIKKKKTKPKLRRYSWHVEKEKGRGEKEEMGRIFRETEREKQKGNTGKSKPSAEQEMRKSTKYAKIGKMAQEVFP